MAFNWIFNSSSRFRNSSGYVFFKDCSQIFMITIGVVILVERGSGAKKRVVLQRQFFLL